MEEKDLKQVERELIGGQPPEFFACEEEPLHNCHVHVSIPAKGLDLQKVFQAERLLAEAGMSFDTGYGGGCRDWEFDWRDDKRRAFIRFRRDD